MIINPALPCLPPPGFQIMKHSAPLPKSWAVDYGYCSSTPPPRAFLTPTLRKAQPCQGKEGIDLDGNENLGAPGASDYRVGRDL